MRFTRIGSAGKRGAIALLALMVAAVGLGASPAGADFTDVDEDAFFAEPVDWLVDQEITTGSPAGSDTFKPLDNVTRGEFATFLWRFAGEPAGAANTFSDVPPGAFYEDAVNWLVENGITTGSPAGSDTFKPLDPVNRAEIATFIWRYFCEPDAAVDAPFTDVVAGSFYETAVNWMFDEGLTTGTSPTTYEPLELSTRGQIATFLHRLAGEPDVGDPGMNRTYGCDDGPEVPDPSSLTDTGAVDFGEVDISMPATQTVTFTNAGEDDDSDIEVTAVAFPAATAGLTISSGLTLPLTLAPGETFDVELTYAPESDGDMVMTTLDVTHDGDNGPTTSVAVTGSGVGTVVLRVNAGGAEVPGTPELWQSDLEDMPSGLHNMEDTSAMMGGDDDDDTDSTASSIDTSSATVPDGTPESVFQSNRFDNASSPAMTWTLPAVAAGDYTLRLYFAELFFDGGVVETGDRTFNVDVEGVDFLDDYNIFVEAGGKFVGIAEELDLSVSDGDIVVEFERPIGVIDASNPMISAIEVIYNGPTPVV